MLPEADTEADVSCRSDRSNAAPGAGCPRVLVAGSIAYFFVSSLSIGLYLYTPELYPTRNRALGVSVATAWLRIASIVGPTLIGLFVGGPGLAYVFLGFGIVALLAAIVMAAFGTETRGRILEELSP